jgi:hypothetical protein
VSEGLNSPGDLKFFTRRVIRLTGMLFALLIPFAGCGIPVSRTTIVPKDVAQNPEDVRVIKKAMTENRTSYRPTRINAPATIASRASIVPMAGI